MMRNGSSKGRMRRRKTAATAIGMEGDHPIVRQHHPPADPAGSSGLVWTEEMHSSFLHQMEAAFVHDILFGWSPGSSGHGAAAAEGTLRLDRYMPDSAESTRDGQRVDAPQAFSPASGSKRSRGRNGCTDGGKLTGVTIRHLPGPEPPKDSDEDDDDDQVVPLFEMPETSVTTAGRGNKERRSRDVI